jgi:Zn finger protein HypA/HybF involved in hydrogenase expression
MELKIIREEQPVDALIEALKSGKYRKAKVKLGELRGNPEKFMRLFDYLTKGTPLNDAKIKISPARARVKCRSCDWKGDPDVLPNDVRCPRCRSEVDILSGNEFHVSV